VHGAGEQASRQVEVGEDQVGRIHPAQRRNPQPGVGHVREGTFGEVSAVGEHERIDARFGAATFTGDASFDSATFTSDARFDSATFVETDRVGPLPERRGGGPPSQTVIPQPSPRHACIGRASVTCRAACSATWSGARPQRALIGSSGTPGAPRISASTSQRTSSAQLAAGESIEP
jgi:hypothetical protein